MKLTKGMKKALSLLLSAAMVVTGVNVTTNTASAEASGTTTSYTIEVVGNTDKETKLNGEVVKSGKTENLNIWFANWEKPKKSHFQLYAPIKEAIAKFKNPVMEIEDVTDGFKVSASSNDASDNWSTISEELNGKEFKKGDVVSLANLVANEKFLTIDSAVDIGVPEGATATIKFYDAPKKEEPSEVPSEKPSKAPASEKPAASASSAAVTSGASAAPSTKPAVEPSAPATTAVATEAPTKAPATATPEPTEKPDEENQAFLMFTDKGYKWGNWNTKVCGGSGKDATITGNGTYTVSINKKDFAKQDDVAAPANGANVFCVDIMGICKTQKFDASKIAFSDVVVKCDGKEIKTDISKMYEGNIEGGQNDNYRLEIRNEYGYGDGEFNTKDEFDEMNPDFTFEDSLSVTFTIKGIKEGKTPEGAFKTADDKSVVAVGGERAKVADVADVVKTAAPSTKPAVTTTKPAVTTKPAITTAAAVKGTSKLTVAKKLVVVAPNKSVKVAFKATKAKNTSGAAVVKATSKSKKVATVKVKGKNVIIKAPKKAVKGASTTVTLKSTKANGKAISAKIKVYVRNSAKKVKAAKKSITVKKGKTKKLVIKASKVQNKKKAFADTITVKGKVLKLTAVKYAKGKATLTLKGAKKAKKKVVKIKVGKKTVKVKATVK